MLNTFFKKVDFIGFKESLKIESYNSSKTILGGLLSFTIVILSVAMAIYLGIEIFVKSEPLVVNSIKMKDDVGPFYFSPDSLEVLISLGFDNFT